MKTLTITKRWQIMGLVAVLAVLTLFALPLAQELGGGVAPVLAGAAVHNDDFTCGILDGIGDLYPFNPPPGTTAFVSNNKGDKLTCHKHFDPQGGTHVFTGTSNTLRCYRPGDGPFPITIGGLAPAGGTNPTSNWQETITGAGDATLQCNFH